MKKNIFLFFLILSSHSVSAQGEANIWYFGRQVGLDFNNGSPPVALIDSAMFTGEGCATISNSNGNLLFYTDGSTIYNKNHQIMASGLFGDTSTTQSAIIVPNPTQSNIYYVFTAYNQGFSPGLNYSIVDMNLNGGLGGVTNLNIHLLDNITEKLTAVLHSNGTDIWVVTHGWESTGNSFLAYLVTSSGVNTTPVTSDIGIYTGWSAQYSIGHLKASPDGTKMVSATSYNVEIYDFDSSTGTLSNLQIINRYAYGAEFSPSNEILYITSHDLHQYDLTASNIEATEILLYSQPPGVELGALQLGPDQKIYMPNHHYLNTINNPDILGVSCNFELETIYFGSDQYTYAAHGLPQFIQSYFYSSLIIENSCLGETTTFEANSSQTIDGILWDFGDGSTSTLESPIHIYVASGTYTVNATITSGSDIITRTKDVIISDTPIAGTINNYEICSGSFDLASRDIEILNGQSDVLYGVAYFHSLTDADGHINKINSPYTSTTNNETIIAKIYNTNNRDCYDTTTFDLIEYEQPVANTVEDYIICEKLYDGFYNFDLSTINSQVLDTQSSSQLDITYHTSQANADGNINGISNSYTNITNPETIFVRIENNQNTICYNTTRFNLEVIQQPTISTITNMYVCDDVSNNGIENVDLSTKNSEVLNGQSDSLFHITYYESETDLLDNTNQISMPFTNTSVNTEIFVKISNISHEDCMSYTSFDLIINKQPIANSINNYIICDDISNNGVALIDLNTFNTEILDTQNTTDFNITYHNSQTDADNNGTPLNTNYTTSSNSETLYVRIENLQNITCYDTTSFNISISYKPVAGQPNDLYLCDDVSNNEIELFDLTSQNTSILNSLDASDFTITYHLSNTEATDNINIINLNFSNTENPQTIFTRIENNLNTDCFDVISFSLNVLETPVLTLEDTIPLCESEPLIINADSGYDEYLWSTGETTQSITVNTIGIYEVTATNVYGAIRCETTKAIEVIASETANINSVKIIDWTQNRNSIIISVENEDNFEFSIDGINYQSSNCFSNLNHGEYTIYIRDIDGCGIVSKEVFLLFYPPFFTPNGDGVNDTWQIYNSYLEPNSDITIFNRFGKVLTKIKPTGLGWDGTYNGSLVLPTDYWFLFRREDGKTYTGHFSLK